MEETHDDSVMISKKYNNFRGRIREDIKFQSQARRLNRDRGLEFLPLREDS